MSTQRQNRAARDGQLELTIERAEHRRRRAKAAQYYRTPAWVVEALLFGGGPDLPGGIWLDPCAGEAAIPEAVNRCRDDVEWLLCELREECRPALERISPKHPGGLVIENFLATPSTTRAAWPTAAVVIFNSPFTLTIPFVEQAWQHGVWVVSLQRQSFIGYARAHWLGHHMPDRYVLPSRPSFRNDGKKDAVEYEWHVWPPDGRDRAVSHTQMLSLPGQLELRM